MGLLAVRLKFLGYQQYLKDKKGFGMITCGFQSLDIAGSRQVKSSEPVENESQESDREKKPQVHNGDHYDNTQSVQASLRIRITLC